VRGIAISGVISGASIANGWFVKWRSETADSNGVVPPGRERSMSTISCCAGNCCPFASGIAGS
jgi:hypothetical protein